MSISLPHAELRIHIVAAKHGVGASTVACGLAVQLSAAGCPTLLASPEPDDLADLCAVTHLFDGHPLDLRDRLTFAHLDHSAGVHAKVAVIDHGTNDAVLTYERRPTGSRDLTVGVIDNSYIALRRAMALAQPDRWVAITDPTRALGLADIASCLGATPLEIRRDPTVARACDAGLFMSRDHRSYRLAAIDLAASAANARRASAASGAQP